jgi:hypothetical protein
VPVCGNIIFDFREKVKHTGNAQGDGISLKVYVIAVIRWEKINAELNKWITG